jgi:peptide methionine sulfoxide reductase MsrA
MKHHTHDFVETYQGLVGYGLDRETDENTVIYYLQKFSDDALVRHLASKMTGDELEEVFMLINRILKHHLSEDEYHQLFLKDDHDHS